MIRQKIRTHATTLEKFRIALDKAGSNPRIAGAMKSIGYNKEIIDEGRALLKSTKDIFNANLERKDELLFVSKEFTKLRVQMEQKFREHRNKVLLLLRRKPEGMVNYIVSKRIPTQFDPWIEEMREFYMKIANDPEIQEWMLRVNLTKEEADAGLKSLNKLENLKAGRYYAKGESEDFTEQKDKAFAKLNIWMSDFYQAARLSMKKEPELLEALYKST